MMKIKTLIQITYLTILVILQIAFGGCLYITGRTDTKVPSAEIVLARIDSLRSNQIQYTFGWSEDDKAKVYKFKLEVDGQIEHAETTENNEIKKKLELEIGSEVKFKVQGIYEDDTESKTIEDAFLFLETVAAVEVVYKESNQIIDVEKICNGYCQYVKFVPDTTRNISGTNRTRFEYYYFSKTDFCNCADTHNNKYESIINCLKTRKKIVCKYHDYPDCNSPIHAQH